MATAAEVREMVRDLHDAVEERDRSDQAMPAERAAEAAARSAVNTGSTFQDGDGGVGAADRARALDDAAGAVMREGQFRAAAWTAAGDPRTGEAGTAFQALKAALVGSPGLPAAVQHAAQGYYDAVQALNRGMLDRAQPAGDLWRAERDLRSTLNHEGGYSVADVHALRQTIEISAQRVQDADKQIEGLRDAVLLAERDVEDATANVPEPASPSSGTDPTTSAAPATSAAAPATASPSGDQFAAGIVANPDGVFVPLIVPEPAATSQSAAQPGAEPAHTGAPQSGVSPAAIQSTENAAAPPPANAQQNDAAGTRFGGSGEETASPPSDASGSSFAQSETPAADPPQPPPENSAPPPDIDGTPNN